MATTRSALTQDDIRTLVKGVTPDVRAAAAYKLCRSIEATKLTIDDRATAQEILRVMAGDAAELVRRALAVTLKASPLVPRDVALRLARDVETISLPMLNFSPVFLDSDLADIVRLGGPVRQLAIARRPMLSRTVTDAIAEHGGERAVLVACANDNADFAEGALQQVMARFESHEKVLAAIAYRNVLPPSVSEALVTQVGDQLRDHLIAHHAVEPETALTLAMGATERATVDLIDQAGRAADVRGFVSHLAAHGRLTPSLMLRGVAQGHMTFFEWGIAELAGVPHHRTWLMIHDAGPLGLRAIYERAGLPARLFPAFRAAVDTYHAMEFDGGARDLERFQQRMLQRFLTQPQTASREDVDYLLDKMDQVSLEAGAEAQAS
ncbi:MAG TPA: DUF2336 domain-containing protein [Phenylobacterium sp.]|jgi:uncharacterized protein (DUF2336 family)|nr:DUF2336 domain-containing protein [Phenylobacterium sp.]